MFISNYHNIVTQSKVFVYKAKQHNFEKVKN